MSVGTEAFEVVCPDTSKLDRGEWLKLRREGLGSSDAAPAMGMSPWVSAYALFCDKRGLLGDGDDTERFWWGRELEPLIIKRGEMLGWWKGGIRHLMVRSTELAWMLSNPDLLCDDIVVEAKTADGFDERRWDEGVPDQYVLQAHHLMATTGRRVCVFPVLFGGHRLRRFDVEWNQSLADMMLEAEADFWRRVENDDPPDPDGSESAMHAVRVRFEDAEPGKVIELPPAAKDWLEERRFQDGTIRLHEAELNQIKARVMEALGDAEVGTIAGKKVCTWKKNRTGNRVLRFVEGEK